MEEKLPTNARPLISPQQRKSRKTKESWNEIPNYRCCWSAMHCRSSDAWLTKVVNRHSSWDSHAPSHQREDFFEDILCRKISESVSFCPPCGISCRSLVLPDLKTRTHYLSKLLPPRTRSCILAVPALHYKSTLLPPPTCLPVSVCCARPTTSSPWTHHNISYRTTH
jgi:hypothetical protein